MIASLIFVGIQVRGSAKATRSATAQAVQENYAAWYLALAGNASALDGSTRGFVDLDALTPPEKALGVMPLRHRTPGA